MHLVKKSKAQLNLRLARASKDIKNIFYHFVNIKRLNKGQIGSLQTGLGVFSDSGHSRASIHSLPRPVRLVEGFSEKDSNQKWIGIES